LFDNTLTGFWYEAGYDRPFGPFELTINGNSFTGTWSYFQGNGLPSEASTSWTGSRSSQDAPDRSLCLAPSAGDASGTYEPGNYLCYAPTRPYQNTEQQSVFGNFVSFGAVMGYTPDNGNTFLLSDFYFPNITTDERYRPENNSVTLGPCSDCFDDDDDSLQGEIPTNRIVVGRLINSAEFCGYFWEGLYNVQIGDGPICFQRTSKTPPTDRECGVDVALINYHIDKLNSANLATFILEKVQDALDALKLPPVIVIPNGNFFTSSSNVNNPSPGTNSYTPGGEPISGSGASTLIVSVVALFASIFALL